MIRRTVAAPILLIAVLASLSGCGGSDSTTDGKSAREVLEQAKKQFDETASVHLTLSTDDEPSSGDAVLGAKGTLTHQPAFEGEVTVVLSGFNADVPVVSVDGTVYAKLPLTPRYTPIDPAEYGAPDPADFADPSRGISGLLLEMDDVEKSGQRRDGDQVLTTYTGTLTGDLVQPIIPSASESGDYETTVGIDDQGRIVTLRVSGEFFEHDGDVTYDLVFDEYGEDVTISAP